MLQYTLGTGDNAQILCCMVYNKIYNIAYSIFLCIDYHFY